MPRSSLSGVFDLKLEYETGMLRPNYYDVMWSNCDDITMLVQKFDSRDFYWLIADKLNLAVLKTHLEHNKPLRLDTAFKISSPHSPIMSPPTSTLDRLKKRRSLQKTY